MRWFLILSFLLLTAQIAQAAPADTRGMLGILGSLEKRLTLLAEQDGNRGIPPYSARFIEASKTAVRDAAIDFRAYLENPDNRATLVREAEESHPLSIAALIGLPDFVEALLAYPEFRADINKPTAHNGTPWLIASMVPAQAWPVCGDGHMMGMAMDFFGYLGFRAATSPYREVRRLLEEAGATPMPDQARDAWLRSCDPSQFDGTYGPRESSPGVRDRVAIAPDIQQAILSELESLARTRHWID